MSSSPKPKFVVAGEALSAIFAEKRPKKLEGAVGITSFISAVLRGNKPFLRQNAHSRIKTFKDKRRALAKGQHVGRRVDHLVRDWIVTGSLKRSDTTESMFRRASHIKSALNARGIVPTAAQVLAVDKALGICSYIDAVGVDRSGTVWVIELKCTTDNVATHQQLYCERTSKGAGMMLNGMRDTQQNHHFLQAGFGAHALRQTYTEDLKGRQIKSCVVVNCTDGTRVYTPGSAFSNPLTFSVGHRGQATAAPKTCVKKAGNKVAFVLDPWPKNMDALWPAIKALGYNVVEPLGKTTRNKHCVLLKPAAAPLASCAVAMCLCKPWSKLPRADKQQTSAYMVSIGKAARRNVGKGTPMLAVVFAPGALGSWQAAWLKKCVVD